MYRSPGLDRTATWKEVCHALSFSFEGAEECGRVRAANVGEEFDFSSPGERELAEDLAWLAIAIEVFDTNLN